MMGVEEVRRRFAYHAPSGGKPETHSFVRLRCEELANKLDVLVPDGREKSLAFTALEEVLMWANAGVARNPEPDP